MADAPFVIGPLYKSEMGMDRVGVTDGTGADGDTVGDTENEWGDGVIDAVCDASMVMVAGAASPLHMRLAATTRTTRSADFNIIPPVRAPANRTIHSQRERDARSWQRYRACVR